jgi:CHAD domain-containing protein
MVKLTKSVAEIIAVPGTQPALIADAPSAPEPEPATPDIRLDVGLHFVLPDLNGLAPGSVARACPDQRLEAIHLDTADLRLLRRKITLWHHRRRTDRGRPGAELDQGWTLRLPTQVGEVEIVRPEHSWPGDPDSVPSEAVGLVKAVSRSEALQRIAKLITQRASVELSAADGTLLGEVHDDVVSIMDGRRLAERFREVEVKLSDQGRAIGLAEPAKRALVAAGGSATDGRSRLVRALGPRATRPPDVAVPTLSPESTLADVVSLCIATGVERMIIHDAGVRMGDHPEHIHQARVGSRRLRSDLGTFKRLLDPGWVESARQRLGWVAEALGAVRDTDVLLERLRANAVSLGPEDSEAGENLLGRLATQRESARRHLESVLNDPGYTELLDDLVSAIDQPPIALRSSREVPLPGTPPGEEVESDESKISDLAPSNGPHPVSGAGRWLNMLNSQVPDPSDQLGEPATPATPAAPEPGGGIDPAVVASQVLGAMVTRPWRQLRRAVRELGEQPEDDALHQVRILAKRLRYAAEAAAVVMGRPAARMAQVTAKLQGVLGDFNDACVAETWLRASVAGGDAAQALVAGQLLTLERQVQADIRRGWRPYWEALDDRRLREWLL